MNKPCEDCLVRPGCSKACYDWAEWFLESGEYTKYSNDVTNYISSMSKEDAIDFVMEVESLVKEVAR